jgi:alpha-beta hydrolase superfamily lysophospholipase
VKSRVKRTLGVVLAAFVVGLVSLTWIVGSKLIQPQLHSVAMPAGFSAQRVAIQGPGHTIAGWWVDFGNNSPVVLLLHGLGADRTSMVSRAELLKRHGFSALLIDLQAEGETQGEAITMGFLESKDVIAARDWIKRTAPGRKLGVIGTSLGGASVLLAPQPSGFDAVVLESVYPRIRRAVENRIRIQLGNLAPILTPLLLIQFEPRLHIAMSDLEPIRGIGQLRAPVLVAAGSLDRHTTLEETQELYDAAVTPKSLWIVAGAIHEDLLAFDPQGYEEHVVGFLSATLAPASAAQAQSREVATPLGWLAIDKAGGENRQTFIDPTRIRIEGSIRRGSSKVVLAPHSQSGAGESASKSLDHIDYQFAFNCATQLSRVEGFTIFFDDGTSYVDPANNYPKPWQPIPGDFHSSWTKLMDFVCKWKST